MKSAFSILALALLVPAMSEAQSPAIMAGARVRVTAPSDNLRNHVTTVMEVRGDSIVLANRDGPRTIALANVTALDVSTGTRTRVLRDAGLGLGMGIIVGALIGASTHEECVPQGIFDCLLEPETSSQSAALDGAVLGVVGLVAGALVGAFDRTDRWSPAKASVRTTISPSRSGGVTLMISRTF